MPGEYSPVRASSVRALGRGSGMPMSRGWVPYGKHATLMCWDLVARKGQGQGFPKPSWFQNLCGQEKDETT